MCRVWTDRADALRDALESAELTAVFSTNYCRTVQTAQPSALDHGLDVQLLPPGPGLGPCTKEDDEEEDGLVTVGTQVLPASVSDVEALADHILDADAGGNVLVVGHGDSVPALLEILGDGSFPPVVIGNDFHHVFLVRTRRFFATPARFHSHYGKLPATEG